jgi:nitric oxide reductase NorE protein
VGRHLRDPLDIPPRVVTDTVTTPPSRVARRTPGEAGTWIFLLGDMVVFGVFFATFLVERAKAPELFDASRKSLHTGIGLTNTFVLLVSSLCVVVAIGAIRGGARSIATRATGVALLCGLTFVGLKVFEYSTAIAAGHGPGANHFYLYYFILTGIHLFHVIVGLVVLVLISTQARRTHLSANRMALVEGGACFWHLVDLLWIVLFPLLYLVS